MPKHKFVIHDVNIQYPPGTDPVPPNPEQLLAQAFPGKTVTIYYGSDVEPSLAVNPKHPSKIVAAWQNNRVNNGGALEAGIAYSHNGGKTWKHSVIPIQLSIGGLTNRVSDVWLSYSIDGKRVFLNALPFNVQHIGPPDAIQEGIITSYSDDDGVTWSKPIFNITSNLSLEEVPLNDKNSITADLQNPKAVYSVWDHFTSSDSFHSDTFFSRSLNKGMTWFPAVKIYDGTLDLIAQKLSNGLYNNNQTINNIIVSLPQKKGPSTLFNFMSRFYAKPTATDVEFINDAFPYKSTAIDVAFVRSDDGGITWTPSATIVTPVSPNNVTYTGGYVYDLNGNIKGGLGSLLRTSGNAIFDVAISPKTGYIYVVHQSDEFRSDLLNQISLRYSNDEGKTWSQPIMVNRTPQKGNNPQAFTPSLDISKDGYIGISYYDFRNDSGKDPLKTKTDAWLVLYKEPRHEHCLKFITEFRLSKQSYIAQNGPTTTQGIMTNGDYAEVIAADDKFYAIYTKSFPGPFNPPIEILHEEDTILLLDKNRRTAPFISIIEIEH